MKKYIALLLALLMMLSLAACGENEGTKSQTSINTKNVNDVINEQINGTDPQPTDTAGPVQNNAVEPDLSVDIDLTAMNSTMVYSEVYNMLTVPENYIEKKIKMKGAFSIYHDEVTDVYYFACIIADATACCSQGIEFVLTGEHVYPDDYPELGSEITVKGTFSTYMEGENMYCTLKDAELI